jgi:hypothetical protein
MPAFECIKSKWTHNCDISIIDNVFLFLTATYCDSLPAEPSATNGQVIPWGGITRLTSPGMTFACLDNSVLFNLNQVRLTEEINFSQFKLDPYFNIYVWSCFVIILLDMTLDKRGC